MTGVGRFARVDGMDISEPSQLDVLQAYAAGKLGTREAIELAGMHDFADLLIGLSRNDLDLPKPKQNPRLDADAARASAILQPLLRYAS